jgi:hypothetical protein
VVRLLSGVDRVCQCVEVVDHGAGLPGPRGLLSLPELGEWLFAGRMVVAAMMTSVRRRIRDEVFVLGDRTMHFPA